MNFDKELMEQILTLPTDSLLRALKKILKNFYEEDSLCATDYYLYAKGEIPILLVAHLDTVSLIPPMEIYYDQEKKVMWNHGDILGADDRAGVYAILTLLNEGKRPSIFFSTDEERGATTTLKFINEIGASFQPVNYMIELDRQGRNECVFYDRPSRKFKKYIESFGFNTKIGSFSDIYLLGPAFKTPSVNLSAGYDDEHTNQEILHTDWLMEIIDKVRQMLDSHVPTFKYPKQSKTRSFFAPTPTSYYNSSFSLEEKCAKCGQEVNELELFPVEEPDESIQLYCGDCVAQKVTWCAHCGQAYVDDRIPICYSCRKDLI